MAVKIQLRRGTASQWTSANPTLSAGEFGFETDTRQYKIGDGTTAWTSLAYYATGTLTGITTASGSGLSGGGTTGVLTLAVDTAVVITKDYVDARGDLFTATANNTPALLSLGTDGQVLIADPSTVGNTKGIKWGQITADGIASDAVTTVKILDSNVTAGKLASDSVTTAKIADSNVTLAKLASAVQNLLIPAGTIAATVKSTADTGWLLLNGQTITSAEGTYPSLWSAAPSSWKSGTSLVLPNLANRTLFQAGATTLGATGGSATIAETNLPSHTHAVDPPSTSVSITDPGHAHPEAGRSTNAQSPGYLQRIGGSGANYDVQGTSTARWDAVTNPATASTTTGISASVNISSFTSGSTGSGTAYYQPHLAVNYQIKAH